jgi:hypothetical protein
MRSFSELSRLIQKDAWREAAAQRIGVNSMAWTACAGVPLIGSIKTGQIYKKWKKILF